MDMQPRLEQHENKKEATYKQKTKRNFERNNDSQNLKKPEHTIRSKQE